MSVKLSEEITTRAGKTGEKKMIQRDVLLSWSQKAKSLEEAPENKLSQEEFDRLNAEIEEMMASLAEAEEMHSDCEQKLENQRVEVENYIAMLQESQQETEALKEDIKSIQSDAEESALPGLSVDQVGRIKKAKSVLAARRGLLEKAVSVKKEDMLDVMTYITGVLDSI